MGVPYAEVIGDPVAHSKSPLIHNFWLRKAGLDGEYRLAAVEASELSSYFQGRRADPDWRGCNVTMPHKEAAVSYADQLSPEAREIEAVNIVSRHRDSLVGANSDMVAIRTEILDFAEQAAMLELPVLVIGAGGAARAVLQILRAIEEIEVVVVNRDLPRAVALLHAFRLRGQPLPLEARLPTAALLVNASCLGMTGFPPLRVNWDDVGRPVVVDMVYSPAETDLLREARARGLTTVDGLTLLIGQAAMSFETFFRIPPPFGVEPKLREMLTS